MKYTVEVNQYGRFWYKEGTDILHREDGPAGEFINGDKEYWLNGKCFVEKEWKAQTSTSSCDGLVAEIDGKKYRLSLLKE